MSYLQCGLRGWLVAATLLAVAGCSGNVPEATGTSGSAVTVCGQDIVHGMDVSHYDGTIDWPTAKGAGIDFAFAKATEGLTFVDPMFATNWAGMQTASVVRGAYHFFHANVDPVGQAMFVVQTVGTLGPDDLPIVLDLETTDGQDGATIAANAITFLDTVTTMTGRTAIVYSSPGFVDALTNQAGLVSSILWVANWGVMCPDVPAPWTNWTFWQHSATGTVAGVPAAAVDLDTFNGTLAQLQSVGGGMMVDAGTADAGDAGSPIDGGTVRDAATPQNDAAVPDDAGQPDAPRPIDMITPGGSTSSGCACTSSPGGGRLPSSGPALVLLGMVLAGVRMRRRRASIP